MLAQNCPIFVRHRTKKYCTKSDWVKKNCASYCAAAKAKFAATLARNCPIYAANKKMNYCTTNNWVKKNCASQCAAAAARAAKPVARDHELNSFIANLKAPVGLENKSQNC
jgi:hypothetical protein